MNIAKIGQLSKVTMENKPKKELKAKTKTDQEKPQVNRTTL